MLWWATACAVSVPLRGKGRDQREVAVSIGKLVKPFPSPCGEKVGINVKPTVPLGTEEMTFPSPCGEKVGINRLTKVLPHTPRRCFRPLAGKR